VVADAGVAAVEGLWWLAEGEGLGSGGGGWVRGRSHDDRLVPFSSFLDIFGVTVNVNAKQYDSLAEFSKLVYNYVTYTWQVKQITNKPTK
jgi:hypothetical protein